MGLISENEVLDLNLDHVGKACLLIVSSASISKALNTVYSGATGQLSPTENVFNRSETGS